MPIVDLQLGELKEYKPPLTRCDDFLAFWDESVKRAEDQPLNEVTQRLDYFAHGVDVSKVTYDGFADRSPIAGLWIRAKKRDEDTPTIIIYHGYGGNKGTVSDHLGWVMLGFSVFAVDVRGHSGESWDYARYSSGNMLANITKGITDLDSYYYKLVYLDCYRAVRYVMSRDGLDLDRIGVTGVSQGGGLSIAVAALHKGVSASMPCVPFLCNFERALNVAAAGPYVDVLNYIKMHPDQETDVMKTLSYFDCMNLAPEVKVPVLMSVGLLDTICPPSTVFATYHHLTAGDKDLAVYPGMGHEELNIHTEKRMSWAVKHLVV